MCGTETALGIWRRLTTKLRKPPPPLGTRGEAYAAKYLKKQGYSLIVRNRREGKGEIDLIVIDGEFLVFVEVRTRAAEDFMTPEASIRSDKRQMLRQTVRRLIRRHQTAGLRPRMDVIAIIWPEGAIPAPANDFLAPGSWTLPAIESAHAFAGACDWGREQDRDDLLIVVCCSGRGDKDVDTAATFFGLVTGEPSSFLSLVLRQELQTRLEERGHDLEWADVIRDLDRLQVVEVEQDGKRFLLRSEAQSTCGKVFQAAGVALPPTVQQVALTTPEGDAAHSATPPD